VDPQSLLHAKRAHIDFSLRTASRPTHIDTFASRFASSYGDAPMRSRDRARLILIAT
jgi:hypothetical protein